jgi:hypothetical protein
MKMTNFVTRAWKNGIKMMDGVKTAQTEIQEKS